MRFSMIPRFRRGKAVTQRGHKSGRRTHRLKFEPLEDRRMLSVGSPGPGIPITLDPVGTYATEIFDESAAEIVAHDSENQRLFVTNSGDQTVDILDMSDPANIDIADPADVTQIDITALSTPDAVMDSATSVAVHGDLVAVAVLPEDFWDDRGLVAFYETDGTFISSVEVGYNPDMVTFTPDGMKVLTADEGQPSDEYDVDPEGTVSIIDVSGGATSATVTTVGFTDFNIGGSREAELPDGVRVFGPDEVIKTTDGDGVPTYTPQGTASVAEDLEPEYVAVSPDSSTAWVSLQENNAFAVIDVASGEVISIQALGTKDHSEGRNKLDASDKDKEINIKHWPANGMYQPDGIAAYTALDGNIYIVSANEGDARDYTVDVEINGEEEEFTVFSEEARVRDLDLDPDAFPKADQLQEKPNLGRLKTTTATGDTDGDGDHDEIYSYGARSFTIWDTEGNVVFDSGADFERTMAKMMPDYFNSTNDKTKFDNRSDDKGPEPESVALGRIGDRTYAFVGLERMGGIMTYDVTDPTDVRFQSYVNNRDFEADPELDEEGVANPEAGDLAPEGLKFIPADKSPTGRPMLAVANEVSGTTTVYEVVPRNGSPAAWDALFGMEEASKSKRSSGKGMAGAVDLLMTIE